LATLYVAAMLPICIEARRRVLEMGLEVAIMPPCFSRFAREVVRSSGGMSLLPLPHEAHAASATPTAHVHAADGTLGFVQKLAPFDAYHRCRLPPCGSETASFTACRRREDSPGGERKHQELQLIERRGDEFPQRGAQGAGLCPLVRYHGWQENLSNNGL